MKIKLVAMMIAMTITIFTFSVWAQNLPTVKMEGNVAKFPKKDKVADIDLSKVVIGRGLNDVPTEFKFMLGKWWRGEDSENLGVYLFVNRCEKNALSLFIAGAEWNRGKPWSLTCSPDGEKTMKCIVRGANPGTGFASLVAILSQKNSAPILEIRDLRMDLREAGDIPKELYVN
jgi:hypothetical protein